MSRSMSLTLALNDNDNSITGEAQITVDFKNDINAFSLDLMAKSGIYGMEISEVLEDSAKANFSFEGNKIKIIPSKSTSKKRVYTVKYQRYSRTGLGYFHHQIWRAFVLWR